MAQRSQVNGTGGRSREGGFTIGELLIAMAMIGVTAVLGVQPLRGLRDSQRTRSAVTIVQSALNMAKGRAVATNQVARVDFTPGGLSTSERFFVVYMDADLDGAIGPGEIAAAALPNRVEYAGMLGYRLPANMQFAQPNGTSVGPLGIPVAADGVTFTNNEIAFYPDGTTTEPGHLTMLDQQQRTYAMTVTVGGAIRVFRFDGSGWK